MSGPKIGATSGVLVEHNEEFERGEFDPETALFMLAAQPVEVEGQEMEMAVHMVGKIPKEAIIALLQSVQQGIEDSLQ